MVTNTLVELNSLRQASNMIDVVVAAGFVQHDDGWFYPPGGRDRALVRLSIQDDIYTICRRRKLSGGWIPIVSAPTSEFQAAAFATWRSSWPLSC